jgi:hypothetical protein
VSVPQLINATLSVGEVVFNIKRETFYSLSLTPRKMLIFYYEKKRKKEEVENFSILEIT